MAVVLIAPANRRTGVPGRSTTGMRRARITRRVSLSASISTLNSAGSEKIASGVIPSIAEVAFATRLVISLGPFHRQWIAEQHRIETGLPKGDCQPFGERVLAADPHPAQAFDHHRTLAPACQSPWLPWRG